MTIGNSSGSSEVLIWTTNMNWIDTDPGCAAKEDGLTTANERYAGSNFVTDYLYVRIKRNPDW